MTGNEFLISDLKMDDAAAVLISICEVFESSQVDSFIVSGFGQEKWPVDCKTDLATIIEQIPRILEELRGNNFDFQLDFYEQGIERQLVFVEDNDLVKVTCISTTHWTPNPSSIFMDKVQISMMFENLYTNFFAYSNVLCSDLANNVLLKDWKK